MVFVEWFRGFSRGWIRRCAQGSQLFDKGDYPPSSGTLLEPFWSPVARGSSPLTTSRRAAPWLATSATGTPAKPDTRTLGISLDSIAGAAFARAVSRRFNTQISSRDMLRHPTLHSLAQALDGSPHENAGGYSAERLGALNGFRGVLLILVYLNHASSAYGRKDIYAFISNRDMTVMWFYVVTAITTTIQFRVGIGQAANASSSSCTFLRVQLSKFFPIDYIALAWNIVLGLDVAGPNLVYFTGLQTWVFERTGLSHICPETRPTHWQGWPFLGINPFIRDGYNTDCARSQPGNELWWVSTYVSLILLLPWVEPFIWRHVDTLFRTTCSLVATWMLCWMSFAFVVWTCVVDIIPIDFPDIRAIGLSCPYMEYCPPLHITYLILGILLGHITYRQLSDVKLMSLSATAWGRVVDLSCLTWLAAQYSPPHMPLRFSDPTSALLADLALRPVLILGFSERRPADRRSTCADSACERRGVGNGRRQRGASRESYVIKRN